MMPERRIIVDHVLFVVGDLDASRRLYTAALAPLGYVELHVQDDGVHYGAEDFDDFAIYRGSPVSTASHVAFAAEDRTAVDLFFDGAMSNGATMRGEPRRVDAVLGPVLRGVRERSAREQRRSGLARAGSNQ
jgi:catechol 2,3-dioxygenase-like lactoylglutathione lyase family enzyme